MIGENLELSFFFLRIFHVNTVKTGCTTIPIAAGASAGEDRQPKPGFFKSLNLSTEQEKLVTDLNLTESKSANTDKDVEMSDPEKSPKRDVLEDVDMSNIDNEEEEMEANPNLNQSRILDYFPPRN